MDNRLRKFAEKVHKLGGSHEFITGIRSTTHREMTMLELHKDASMLVRTASDTPKLQTLINEMRGKLRVAQVTNTIGTKDLDELLDDLDEIEKEL